MIRYLAIQRWKGEVPMYSSSQAPIPFMSLPDARQGTTDGGSR